MEPHDYWIYYVNINLRQQSGISVTETQTFLPAKRPKRRGARRNCCFRRLARPLFSTIRACARAVCLGKGVSFILIKLIAKGREALFPGTIFLHRNGDYKVSATLDSHQPTARGQAGYEGTQGDPFKGGRTRYNTMAIHHRHCQTPSYR